MRFVATFAGDIDVAVYSVGRDLTVILDIATFCIHTFCNTMQTEKVYRFWEKLRTLENQMKNVGIRLDYKRLKTIAYMTVVPEYLVFCLGAVSYLKTMNFTTVMDFVGCIVIGKPLFILKGQKLI